VWVLSYGVIVLRYNGYNTLCVKCEIKEEERFEDYKTKDQQNIALLNFDILKEEIKEEVIVDNPL
jgi:hypothetical protein